MVNFLNDVPKKNRLLSSAFEFALQHDKGEGYKHVMVNFFTDLMYDYGRIQLGLIEEPLIWKLVWPRWFDLNTEFCGLSTSSISCAIHVHTRKTLWKNLHLNKMMEM